MRPGLVRGTCTALLAVFAGFAAGGCVAAGFATAPVVSAVQLISDRSVARTVTAGMPDAWAATESALERLGFRMEKRHVGDSAWHGRGLADAVTVLVALERVTARATRVTIRVEPGGLLADRQTAATIHDEIARGLIAAAQVRPAVSRTDALTALEAEVRRLRSEMQDGGGPRRPLNQATPEPFAVRVQSSGVVTIPLSAAVPSAAGPVPPTTVVHPVGIVRPIVVDAPPPTAAMAKAPSTVLGTARTAPLTPAEALVPIQPVTAPRSPR